MNDLRTRLSEFLYSFRYMLRRFCTGSSFMLSSSLSLSLSVFLLLLASIPVSIWFIWFCAQSLVIGICSLFVLPIWLIFCLFLCYNNSSCLGLVAFLCFHFDFFYSAYLCNQTITSTARILC